ncbi:hypothetical protein HA466_0265720 [Hirschfeldia incana]|nr:hypothetical protein HA466_0265720 [Hirschfeldia incana]
MEVPVIYRISDFDVGINSVNDPSLLSQQFAVSGVGNDSDSSFSSDSSDDEEDDGDKEDDSVNGDSRVKRFSYFEDNDDKGINGNVPWLRRCSSSFGDLLSWPDLGGFGSSGVVKLWDNLDLKGSQEALASFFNKYGASSPLSPAVFLAAEKKGSDAVEVSAWDARDGFRMPALLAEWRQPGRLLGKIVRVNAGGADKIYVEDDGNGEITVGDVRMVDSAMTGVTELNVGTKVKRRRRQ